MMTEYVKTTTAENPPVNHDLEFWQGVVRLLGSLMALVKRHKIEPHTR